MAQNSTGLMSSMMVAMVSGVSYQTPSLGNIQIPISANGGRVIHLQNARTVKLTPRCLKQTQESDALYYHYDPNRLAL